MKAIIIACLVSTTLGFGSYRDQIPNGRSVRNPCGAGSWQAVGHTQANKGSGGALNSFANDFNAAGRQWNRQICQADSDGDGMTNGQELGDPNCTWQAGQPVYSASRGHPGICEPVTSSQCRQRNSFLNQRNCPRLARQGGVNTGTGNNNPSQCVAPCFCSRQQQQQQLQSGVNPNYNSYYDVASVGDISNKYDNDSNEVGREKRQANGYSAWIQRFRQMQRQRQRQRQPLAQNQSGSCNCQCPNIG